MIKSIFAVQGLNAHCQLASCSYVHLVVLENTLNKVYAKRGGRQLNMITSENICSMVDLFDKAVAEGTR